MASNSRHRKNHKKKVRARNQRIKDNQNRFNNLLMEEIQNYKQEMEIVEKEDTKDDNEGG
jgi:hypothetical protein